MKNIILDNKFEVIPTFDLKGDYFIIKPLNIKDFNPFEVYKYELESDATQHYEDYRKESYNFR